MSLKNTILGVESAVVALLVLVLAGIAGCGAPEVDTGEAVQAICADDIKPGCDTCYPDPSSPKGGYQTCWTCGGNHTKKACIPPPPPCGAKNQPCCEKLYCDSGLTCLGIATSGEPPSTVCWSW
jgi:hypothetical protein